MKNVRVGISLMELVGDVTLSEERARLCFKDRSFTHTAIRTANEHEWWFCASGGKNR